MTVLYQEATEDSDSDTDGHTSGKTDSSQQSVQSGGENEEIDAESGLQTQQNPREKLLKIHQEKLDELDEEMKDRIITLHHELTSQGMHGAADLLQDCFDPPTPVKQKQIPARGGESGKQAGQIPTTQWVVGNKTKQNNKNCNHNVPRITKNKSVETIYEPAVNKRGSSSSEDNVILSDESFNNETFHITGRPLPPIPIRKSSVGDVTWYPMTRIKERHLPAMGSPSKHQRQLLQTWCVKPKLRKQKYSLSQVSQKGSISLQRLIKTISW